MNELQVLASAFVQSWYVLMPVLDFTTYSLYADVVMLTRPERNIAIEQ